MTYFTIHGGINQHRCININKQIKSQTFKNKLQYKNKIETKLSSNDTKGAWEGFKTASGMKPKKVSISVPNEEEYSDDLNAFYSRFDISDFRKECTGPFRVNDLSIFRQFMVCWGAPTLDPQVRARPGAYPGS